MSKKATYEENIEELETIIKDIEAETISVDEIATKVKRAAELIRKCQAVLHATGKEVDDILKSM